MILSNHAFVAHLDHLKGYGFKSHPSDAADRIAPADDDLIALLTTHNITHRIERTESEAAREIRLRVEAVNRWYVHDWNTLDNKIRSSIVEGVSVFLSMFDLPHVARVFCPHRPETQPFRGTAEAESTDAPKAANREQPPLTAAAFSQPLPPLDQLIDHGKVLALNMPAGTNPALARAIGVMLKNAWLQSLLRRPAKMKAHPHRYVRPAVFLCDEYQAFASRRRGRPERRRESLCPHPAMPRHPHRRHAVHLIPPVGIGQFRGVADALANAPHPDLFELE